MSQNNGKTELAKEYRAKYGGEMPTLKLARIMYNDNNLLFRDVEDARTYLRYIEGKSWKTKAKYEKLPDRPKNPYNLPESDEKPWLPFEIKAKRVLVLSDIHVPYHSPTALTAAFDWAKNEKPDAVLLNGDTIDFHGLSRFVKNPKARSVAHELDAFKGLIQAIRDTFPAAAIYYKMGNHCERYEHFLRIKAHELIGVEEFDFQNIIKTRAEGITVISDKRIVKLGSLNAIHGHEFGGSVFSPVNIARGLFLRGKVNAIQGHNHQTSEHTEPNMDGDITTTWSIGCLCDLHPEFLPINRWNHGFMIVDVDGQNFHVRNKRIHKGVIL